MGRKEDGPLNGQLFMIYRLHFYFPLSGASLLGERLLLFTKILLISRHLNFWLFVTVI